MKKGIFKKAEFYSYMRIDGKNKPVKHKGYTDGEYYYYHSNGVWFAVDDYTGLAICNRETLLDECYQKVHSEYFQNLLKEIKNSERYDEQCSKWYQALVMAGIIQETTF